MLPAESTVSARKVNTAAANEQQRRDFMAAYGWEVEEEPLEIQEVLIPSEFDETYEKYNYIQKQQGFDLSRYRGKVWPEVCLCAAGVPGRCGGRAHHSADLQGPGHRRGHQFPVSRWVHAWV